LSPHEIEHDPTCFTKGEYGASGVCAGFIKSVASRRLELLSAAVAEKPTHIAHPQIPKIAKKRCIDDSFHFVELLTM